MTRNEIPAKTTDLRKFAAKLGLKGMSSANKATLTAAINEHFDKVEAEEAAKAKPAKKAKAPKTRKAESNGVCVVCKIAKINAKTQGADSTMCTTCFDEGGIENEHQDGVHEAGTHFGCPMCFPVTVPEGPRTTTSYRFMVAALRKGWSVEIVDLCEGDANAFQVTATKDDTEITLTWRNRAFQYYTKESYKAKGEKKALILNASQAHGLL